ncbi:AGE family epimerase/isomerase [Hyphococcus sp.]|uniref:AGE family epimerase/isomerase n=1 Tax=Hyphococcus sp. TaxID=2038636 RepID=UPI003CCBFC91
MSGFQSSQTRFRRWFEESALPLWVKNSYDHIRGGFFEALNLRGEPLDNRPRRVRAQARQIHTFSQVGLRGWHGEAENLAAEGFEHFLQKACPDFGARGCVHLIGDNGEIIDDKRDLYDQAFLLLTCASRWKAAKDERALELAKNTINFMQTELASPYGGWLENDQNQLPRRQNPHMHLFEAFMALYKATDDKDFYRLADKIIGEGFSRFYDSVSGVIIEFFKEDFSRDDRRGVIEPGHMLEWVWLLSKWEAISGADYAVARETLFMKAAQFGEDPDFYSFINNQAYIEDPHYRSSKRLWPQTEYLKACCIQGAGSDEHAFTRAAALIDDIFKTYLATDVAGLWIDEFDKNGAPVSKDVPSSILYHLFEALDETENALRAERAS